MRLGFFLVFAICCSFAEGPLGDNFKISSNRSKIKGKEIKYSAIAGTLPVNKSGSQDSVNVFFISYTLDSESKSDRPVTFLFNGGPGSSSVFLHFSAFGPKKIDFEEKMSIGSSVFKLIDNDYSLLEYSDLVFIDPVGTGFSDKYSENISEFYSLQGDAGSIGDFICKYLTTFDRWLSGKYIIGESYGTIRALLVGNYLQDNYGIYLNGISLISPVIKASHLTWDNGFQDYINYALLLPSFSATAWYHGRLSSDLQSKELNELISEVKLFALNEYVLSLFKGDLLTQQERDKIVNLLSYYTGIAKDKIEKADLKIDLPFFLSSVLPDDKSTDLDCIVGAHDARCVGYSKYCFENPSVDQFIGGYASIANNYIRNELGYFYTDPYLIFNFDANRSWCWEKDCHKDPKNLDMTQDIRHLFMVNPGLKIFVASGLYDLVTPFAVAEFDINHLHLPLKLRSKIEFKTYEGGHMMYMNKSIHEKLTSDIREMYKE